MTGLRKAKRVKQLNFTLSICFLVDPVLTLFKFSCTEGRLVHSHRCGVRIHLPGTLQIIAAIPELLAGIDTVFDLPQNHRSAAVRTVGFRRAADILNKALPELRKFFFRPVQQRAAADRGSL